MPPTSRGGIRPGIRRFFQLALRGRRQRLREVDDEIAAHIEHRTEQLVRQGWAPDEARAEAERRFGDMDEARRTLHASAGRTEAAMGMRERIGAVWADLRYTMRSLAREPLFTLTVVATLGLGIGANAVMFGIIDRLLLRGPEHVVAGDRLARLVMTVPRPNAPPFTSSTLGYAWYLAMKERATRAFSGAAAYTVNESILGSGGDSRIVRVGFATADFFPLTGAQPAVGRWFTAEEDAPPRGMPVVVLDHEHWTREYGGDPGVIGRMVELRGQPHRIVGVAPRNFTGVTLQRVDFWAPMTTTSYTVTDNWQRAFGAQWLQVVVRLAPGVTMAQATEAANAAFRAAAEEERDLARARLTAVPVRYTSDGAEPGEAGVTRWLTAVAAIVLLVAAANVTSLLLARAVRRRREVAVRVAMGIGRGRLARLLLLESVGLALLGAVVGLLLAYWGGALVRSVLLPDVAWGASPVSGRVLMVSVAIALGTGLLIGLAPVLEAQRTDLSGALKSGAQAGGGRRQRTRTLLTAAQAALSVVLLVGAGLFVRSLSNVRGVDLGIEPDRIMLVALRWRPAGNVPPEQMTAIRARRAQVYAQAYERLRQHGAFAGAALAVGTPFRSSFMVRLRVPGLDSVPRVGGRGPSISAVTGSYFPTAGLGIARGRGFTDADGANTQRVAIVNETMAQALWPGQDALGKCLVIGAESENTGGQCTTVVGVARNAHLFAIREEPLMQYYVPVGQEVGIGGTSLLLRPRDPGADRAEIEAVVRKEMMAIDPTLLFVETRLLAQSLEQEIRPWKLGATMFALFGVLALLVAAIGLYSVIAYMVTQRTHEMGVRVALGAQPTDVVGLVVRHGLRTALAGVAVGVVLALIAGRWAGDMLFETSPRDPLVFGAVVVAMVATAALASFVPARRASRVDPAVALRAD